MIHRTHHSDVLAMLASIYRPDIYVELGLYHGETFKKVKNYCRRAIGVDISEINLDGEIHICTTDKFFNKIFTDEKADMIFIDADHKYDSVVKDLENSLKSLNQGGCIILHDTDPESNHLFTPGYCGDSYKVVDYLESRDDLNVITIPCSEAGLSIITRKNETRTQIRLNKVQ